MTVKEKITARLESGRGEYISGEELAAAASCTRGAVWKAVQALRADGYNVEAVTNRGYRLIESGDSITESGIMSRLPENSKVRLEIRKRVDSTNTLIKELAAGGAPEWTVAVALEQTGGKGRLGRSFISPSETGVYMSILLRPKMPAKEATLITAAAAVAVAETLEDLSGREAGIKWVNDVYVGGLKACGILTEAALSLENGGVEYAVLGIGINVYEPKGGFPPELRGRIGAVFQSRLPDTRNKVIAGVIERFSRFYDDLGGRGFIPAYRERLMWKGGRINLISQSGSVPALLIGADDNASLIVRYDDGSEGLVSSGEISIRLDG